MVAERKRVSRLVWTPAHPKVSLSRPTATGGGRDLHAKLFLRRNSSDVVQNKRSAKTDWQCRPARKW
ncbi:hypothetical protein A7P21_07510 [Acinetobacter seifertii]|nr:hypothetical protein A7P21_07510 [Acinetobacter seifertii]